MQQVYNNLLLDVIEGVKGYGVLGQFQQYFNYIVAVSFIGGGKWNPRRKLQTCRKSQTNFIK